MVYVVLKRGGQLVDLLVAAWPDDNACDKSVIVEALGIGREHVVDVSNLAQDSHPIADNKIARNSTNGFAVIRHKITYDTAVRFKLNAAARNQNAARHAYGILSEYADDSRIKRNAALSDKSATPYVCRATLNSNRVAICASAACGNDRATIDGKFVHAVKRLRMVSS